MVIEAALISSAVSALLPALTDWIGAVVNKWTGGAGALPKNVDEAIKLQAANIEHLKALAELDRPYGDISRWVSDLRASFRPIIAISAFAIAILSNFVTGLPEDSQVLIFMIAANVTSYLFGERMLLKIKGVAK